MRNSFSMRPRPSEGGFKRNGRPVRYNNNQRRGNKNGSYIDPKKFVNKTVAPADEVMYESTNNFIDFKLSDELKQNIIQAGYTTPTAIQDGAIPAIIDG